VTSCTRCRSTYSTAGVSRSRAANQMSVPDLLEQRPWFQTAPQTISGSGGVCAGGGRRRSGSPPRVCLRAGQHDVGAQAAAAVVATSCSTPPPPRPARPRPRSRWRRRSAQRALTRVIRSNALEHRRRRARLRWRLVELAAVPGQERHGGGRRRPGAAHRVELASLPAAGRPSGTGPPAARRGRVCKSLLLVGELLQFLEHPARFCSGLEAVAQIAEPSRSAHGGRCACQDQVGALEATSSGRITSYVCAWLIIPAGGSRTRARTRSGRPLPCCAPRGSRWLPPPPGWRSRADGCGCGARPKKSWRVRRAITHLSATVARRSPMPSWCNSTAGPRLHAASCRHQPLHASFSEMLRRTAGSPGHRVRARRCEDGKLRRGRRPAPSRTSSMVVAHGRAHIRPPPLPRTSVVRGAVVTRPEHHRRPCARSRRGIEAGESLLRVHAMTDSWGWPVANSWRRCRPGPGRWSAP